MDHVLTCTFCKKSEHQVLKLVAGPGVYICDACIEAAHAIIHDSPAPPHAPRTRTRIARLGQRLATFVRSWQRIDVACVS